jgi:hypothetical protein
MPRRACGSIDHVEFHQPWIKKGGNRVKMANKSDTANGKAGLGTNQSCIGFAQRFARDDAGFDWVDPITPSCDKQDRLANGLASENHGLGNRIQCAAYPFCRLLCCVGFWPKFQWHDLKLRIFQNAQHTFQAFAHSLLVLFGEF